MSKELSSGSAASGKQFPTGLNVEPTIQEGKGEYAPIIADQRAVPEGTSAASKLFENKQYEFWR
ncbi:hypothetical protein PC9H_005689 [Pleurotus ostreatus]|uniref:Uncharacterized protein n=1 Tax=Pleurotus ostreatus TaxID=5322 RepID=A0A8H6ZZH3_PLEOS|nr:uncharacterized protein PC9H_005689 [Pleurotus ostreatus]KAF7433724.1 hypothetical protein PC9H_005689 [Pleurotus ostreatus]KAJ8697503.1 hypothetical protein PTI98_004304 [Pleurotus ostreatus]